MSRLVIINLGSGNLQDGCSDVTAQIFLPRNDFLTNSYPSSSSLQCRGSLPPAPEIERLYESWRLLYREFYQKPGCSSTRTIQIESGGITNFSEIEFSELSQQLKRSLNRWLNSDSFLTIDRRLSRELNSDEEIQLIIETNDDELRRLPWHLWDFLDYYQQAEVALSTLEHRRVEPRSQTPTNRVRILAIFGQSESLDLQADRRSIEAIPNAAPFFLESPSRRELDDHLWNSQGWDILFFAGHSQTEREAGRIYINETDSLTLSELRHALRRAIHNGLKLAIFNSCDGLGLARNLADLHIPQVIVMREPVPDVVAQEFFRNFLVVFSSGQSLYASVREARERLERLEGEYPCATWLPVICQNPTALATSWQDYLSLPRRNSENQTQLRLVMVMLVSVLVTALIIGLRLLGLFQSWELQAYDRLMRLQPDEKQDDRLLVVTITEEDFQLPEQKYRTGARSLSDLALARLLEKLAQFKPRAVGLDIYHPNSVSPEHRNLAVRFQNDDNFFAICSVGEANQPNQLGIAPSPELPPERQGFSDIVVDSDGVLRRHLVAMKPDFPSSCLADYALSTQLGFHYLAREGKNIKYTEQGNLQIGDVVFNRLPAPINGTTGNIISKFWRSRRGGYQDIDAWGYQILLNYRSHKGSPLKIAPTVTLAEVLKGQIDPELVKDRIVLIGVTAPSAGDYLSTPYSSDLNLHQQMSGVMALAQMTSQILSAVLDGRPLISVWSFWGEVLWVWNWSAVGGILVWWVRGRSQLVIMGVTTLGVLYLSCWVLLIQGVWVPLVPSVFSLVFTGAGVMAIFSCPNRTATTRC